MVSSIDLRKRSVSGPRPRLLRWVVGGKSDRRVVSFSSCPSFDAPRSRRSLLGTEMFSKQIGEVG